MSPVLELSVEVVEAIPQDGFRGDVSSRSSIAHCVPRERLQQRAVGSRRLRYFTKVIALCCTGERCVNYIVGCFLVPLERFQLRTVEQLWAFPCTIE